MKVMEIETKHYQLQNILTKFDHIDEKCVMDLKSENIENMIGDKADKVMEEKPFKPMFYRYQTGLETSLKGSKFVFDSAHLLHC